MRQLLTILILFLTTISYSQTYRDIEYFFSVKSNDESSFKYFMSILNKFDSTDQYKNFLCDKASERIGDIYKFRKDYSRAIDYYDSADTKYRDKNQFCGNDYYPKLINRIGQISLCYFHLNEIDSAIIRLTPYVFSPHFNYHIDNESELASQYESYLLKKYSKCEIIEKIENAINTIQCDINITRASDSLFYVGVNSSISLFGASVEVANYWTTSKTESEIVTKESIIRKLKKTLGYTKLILIN